MAKPYHHGDLRNALLSAAVREIRDHGVPGFSLRRVAGDVGVSPSAAYRHFPDKAALLAAVAEEGFRRMSKTMQKTIESYPQDPSSVFHATGLGYVRFAVSHPEHFRVMFAHPSEPVPDDPYTLLTRALDALVANGTITDARREGAELVAWTSVHGLATLLVDRALPARSKAEVDALFQVVSDAVRRSLRP